MTKAVKELIVVFVVGAGVLTLLWGLLHQINTSIIPGQSNLISRIMWSAVWSGVGLIVAGAAVGLLLKPTR
jgi:uncharacterized membrane protein YidH (DUF202 family)